ncbi:bifunctional diguanylate cyclase/phosphodiesterase [Scandinavium manionii]|uniref:bifunctional diguanylate cyclase/phosphodiesterase n=1 Tax=Scandinavium manionii TaxID=2926520 RepID=UPI001357C020|nr:EAL domain-containing protein [Scandinavium manionii]MCS2164640.1 EAL domain-containing protein [Scandinavium manionii]
MKNTISHSKYPVSLACALAGLAIVSFCIAGAMLAMFVSTGMDETIRYTGERLIQSSGANVVQTLEDYMDLPTVTNQLFARTFENSDLDALSATQVTETLKQLIRTDRFGHVSVDRVSFTTPDGNYVAFNRLDVNNKKIINMEKTSGDAHNILNVYEGSTEYSRVVKTIYDFNKLVQPWLEKAEQSKKSFWSRIYPRSYNKNDRMLAYRTPVYNRAGKLLGVISSEIMPDSMSRYVCEVLPFKDNTILITGSDNNIVSSSEMPITPALMQPELASAAKEHHQADGKRLTTKELRQLLTPEIMEKSTHQGSPTEITSGKGDKYIVHTIKYGSTDRELHGHVLLITSQDSLSGSIKKTIIAFAVKIMGLFAIVYLIAAIVLRNFFSPLNTIIGKNKDLLNMQWKPEENKRLFPEVATLDSSFFRLSHELAARTEKHRKLVEEDNLTGLPTRAGLLSKPESYEGKNLLARIHVSNAANIARVMGLEYSGRFLRSFVSRMKNTLPGGTLLCRDDYGSFLAIFPEVYEQKDLMFFEDILQSLFLDIKSDGDAETERYCFIGNSGMFFGHMTQERMPEVILNSGIAVQHAEKIGNGKSLVFVQEMQDQGLENIRLHEKLQHAIANDEFHIVMQPIINLDNQNSCNEGESLIRWQTPDEGFISPIKFISLAEESGLIIPIGRWVIAESCKQLAKFIARGGPKDFKLHVNISAIQLQQPDFASHLFTCIQENELMNGNICVEITESTLMKHTDQIVDTLKYLRRLGVTVAIDDFGSGYSSLSYLHSFPFDCLKIDRTFVSDILTNEKNAAVVSSVLTLAKSFNVPLVAEGVETLEMAEKLQEMGCELVQGYYFSRPLPFDDFTAAVNRG